MKILPKHKQIKTNHSFQRHGRDHLLKAWSYLVEGMRLIDKTLLKEMLSERKEDKLRAKKPLKRRK